MTDDEKLTKVYVDLPNHWAAGGESMWAVDLGGDLYELRNTPFYSYDLNFRDVVRARAGSPDVKPEVSEVVRRSGHRTLRVVFEDALPVDRRVPLLESLRDLLVSVEGATDAFFALDLEPEADITRVRGQLDEWERNGWLTYETCEARVSGGFDDRPPED
jgi:hypothetical protein